MNNINAAINSQEAANSLLNALEKADKSRPTSTFEWISNFFNGRQYEYIATNADGKIKSSMNKSEGLPFEKVTELVREALTSSEVSNDTKESIKNNFKKMIDHYQEKHNNFLEFFADLFFMDFSSAVKAQKALDVISDFDKSNKK